MLSIPILIPRLSPAFRNRCWNSWSQHLNTRSSSAPAPGGHWRQRFATWPGRTHVSLRSKYAYIAQLVFEVCHSVTESLRIVRCTAATSAVPGLKLSKHVKNSSYWELSSDSRDCESGGRRPLNKPKDGVCTFFHLQSSDGGAGVPLS